MKKIYLFCSAGMSTSMLAQEMQNVADAHGLPLEVKAILILKSVTLSNSCTLIVFCLDLR